MCICPVKTRDESCRVGELEAVGTESFTGCNEMGELREREMEAGSWRGEEKLSLEVVEWPGTRTEVETDFFRTCGGEFKEEPGILRRGEARIGQMVGLMAEATEEEGEPQDRLPELDGGGDRLVVEMVSGRGAGLTGMLAGAFERSVGLGAEPTLAKELFRSAAEIAGLPVAFCLLLLAPFTELILEREAAVRLIAPLPELPLALLLADALRAEGADSLALPLAAFEFIAFRIPINDSFPMLSPETCKLVIVEPTEFNILILVPSFDNVGKKSPEPSSDEDSLSGTWISFPSNDILRDSLGSKGSGFIAE